MKDLKSKGLKKKDTAKRETDDMDLMASIAPRGGISFRDERYISSGEGYTACLHITDWPENVSRYWGIPLTGITEGVVTIDVYTPDQNTVRSNINKSFWNQYSLNEGETDVSERSRNDYNRGTYSALLKELESQQETVKYIIVRIFISADTREKLENMISAARARLKGARYTGLVLVGENKTEYRSLTLPYPDQYGDLPEELRRTGQPVTTSALADMYPFHFTKITDEGGSLWGFTDQGGRVIFDQFTSSDRRTGYDAVVLGKKGSGKSTILKKAAEERIIRGDIIRGLDPSGEWENFVKEYGGAYIQMDGTAGAVNPMEVMETADSEGVTFQRHLAKLRTLYGFFKDAENGEKVDIGELMEFEELVCTLYTLKGFPKEGRYSGLEPDEYPLLSDLLELAEKTLYVDTDKKKVSEDLSAQTRDRLENIVITLKNTVKNYPGIFNTVTSIPGMTDEQIVYFGLSNVMRMNPSVAGAILFNTIMLCWDNCFRNGRKMLERYNAGDIEWNDIVRSLIIIDEAHNIINTSQKNAVREIHRIIMEDRKYFTAVIYASPSVSSFIRNTDMSEECDMITAMFNETQYKFLLRQDDNALGLLRNVFGDSVPENYLKALTRFGRGECLLHVSGEGTTRFKVHLNDRARMLYGGGA